MIRQIGTNEPAKLNSPYSTQRDGQRDTVARTGAAVVVQLIKSEVVGHGLPTPEWQFVLRAEMLYIGNFDSGLAGRKVYFACIWPVRD